MRSLSDSPEELYPKMVSGSIKGKNTRSVGGSYEDMAARFLAEKGFRILARNYRCRMGEIDLIAMDGETLVFVEVKYRADESGGGPLAAVDRRKQRKISKVALYYLYTNYSTTDVACRVDVIGITDEGVQHVMAAFDYCG